MSEWFEEDLGLPFGGETSIPGYFIPGLAIPGYAGVVRTSWTEESDDD